MLKVYGKSDIGKARSSNQDSFCHGVFDDGSVWAVVCDGMGGANGGNIASDIAVKAISDFIKEKYKSNFSTEKIEKLLVSSIEKANDEVYRYARKNSELIGMGTTVVAAIVSENKARMAYVGDSRAYRINSAGAVQITHDHSVVQSLIDQGKITQDEAKTDPRKSIITRAVGVSDSVQADYCECDFSASDSFLLCSDGLSNYVDEQSIVNEILLFSRHNPAQRLVDIANDNGGGDNITAVIICNDEN